MKTRLTGHNPTMRSGKTNRFQDDSSGFDEGPVLRAFLQADFVDGLAEASEGADTARGEASWRDRLAP